MEVLDRPGDAGRAPIVLLHEGLGSAQLWRDVPEALGAATGRRVIAYSRPGHGRSPLPEQDRDAAFYDREADDVLPALLDRLGIETPLLVGHSDGATIALIHAGRHPVGGLVLLAPHTFVEAMTVAGIRRTVEAYEQGGLRDRLARHHDDIEHVFRSWADLWLDPGFADWDRGADVAALRTPTLVIQGVDDEYSSLAQVERIEREAPGPVTRLDVPGGHFPQVDARDEVLAAIADYSSRVR